MMFQCTCQQGYSKLIVFLSLENVSENLIVCEKNSFYFLSATENSAPYWILTVDCSENRAAPTMDLLEVALRMEKLLLCTYWRLV